MPAEKYTLRKIDPSTGEAPPCAFFLSEKGCKNGDKCKFSHKRPASTPDRCSAPALAHIEDVVSSDVVSSESEDERPKTTSTPKPQQSKKAKNKVQNSTNNSSLSSPGASAEKHQPNVNNNKTPNNTPKSNQKRKKNQQEEADHDSYLGLFSKPKKRVKVTKSPAKELAQTPTQKVPPKSPAIGAPGVPSFRALKLPIATFSTEDGTVQTVKADPPLPPPPKEDSKYPIPKSTPEGLKWQNAVLFTRANPKYSTSYDYDKMKATDAENKVNHSKWIKARPYGPWCASNPHAIAIDCEMCETQCPETGAVDSKALCRISVVNALDPSEVLIDTLVKPAWPVKDYRTRINGISEESLNKVEFTMKHAQEFMMALCSEETVVIGHALHNDFNAMKMEHHCNVDSSLLFKCKDAPEATCSLKDLAKTVMKKDMPNIHCSTNDARMTLYCVEEGYLKKDGKPELVERTVKPKRRYDELFVHRVPKGCKPEHIQHMFLVHTAIKPEEVQDLEYKGNTGKTNVKFTSAEHANLAFATLEGEAKEDKGGRLQKRIYLRNGDYCYIRKMNLNRKRLSGSCDDLKGKGKEEGETKEPGTPSV